MSILLTAMTPLLPFAPQYKHWRNSLCLFAILPLVVGPILPLMNSLIYTPTSPLCFLRMCPFGVWILSANIIMPFLWNYKKFRVLTPCTSHLILRVLLIVLSNSMLFINSGLLQFIITTLRKPKRNWLLAPLTGNWNTFLLPWLLRSLLLLPSTPLLLPLIMLVLSLLLISFSLVILTTSLPLIILSCPPWSQSYRVTDPLLCLGPIASLLTHSPTFRPATLWVLAVVCSVGHWPCFQRLSSAWDPWSFYHLLQASVCAQAKPSQETPLSPRDTASQTWYTCHSILPSSSTFSTPWYTCHSILSSSSTSSTPPPALTRPSFFQHSHLLTLLRNALDS